MVKKKAEKKNGEAAKEGPPPSPSPKVVARLVWCPKKNVCPIGRTGGCRAR